MSKYFAWKKHVYLVKKGIEEGKQKSDRNGKELAIEENMIRIYWGANRFTGDTCILRDQSVHYDTANIDHYIHNR